MLRAHTLPIYEFLPFLRPLDIPSAPASSFSSPRLAHPRTHPPPFAATPALPPISPSAFPSESAAHLRFPTAAAAHPSATHARWDAAGTHSPVLSAAAHKISDSSSPARLDPHAIPQTAVLPENPSSPQRPDRSVPGARRPKLLRADRAAANTESPSALQKFSQPPNQESEPAPHLARYSQS